MAYSGWLLKIGNYIVPMSFMKAETYSPYVNMQDLDDYTDANGYLHRNAVELKALKVEFETTAMLTNKTFNEVLNNIRSQFTNATGRACYITAYIPEYDDYVTQYGYMADFQPTIYGTYDGIIRYNSVRLAFIGGVRWLIINMATCSKKIRSISSYPSYLMTEKSISQIQSYTKKNSN